MSNTYTFIAVYSSYIVTVTVGALNTVGQYSHRDVSRDSESARQHERAEYFRAACDYKPVDAPYPPSPLLMKRADMPERDREEENVSESGHNTKENNKNKKKGA